jgi:hypothetical protein
MAVRARGEGEAAGVSLASAGVGVLASVVPSTAAASTTVRFTIS